MCNKLFGRVSKEKFLKETPVSAISLMESQSSNLNTSPTDVNNGIVQGSSLTVPSSLPTVSANSVAKQKSPESHSDTSLSDLYVSGVSSHTQGQPAHTPVSDSHQ